MPPQRHRSLALLKTDFCNRSVWLTKKCATLEVGAWIEAGYSRRRRYASLGQIPPVGFELRYSDWNAELKTAASPCVYKPEPRPVLVVQESAQLVLDAPNGTEFVSRVIATKRPLQQPAPAPW